MSKYRLHTTEIVANFLHNYLSRKNLIILIGEKGIFLAAFGRNEVIETMFIETAEQENYDKYQYFFNKYKNFHIFFLLDNSICNIKHELVPVLQSIVKVDPIEKFIKEHFTRDDIIAYNIYNISTDNSEIWHTMIASTACKPPFSTLLNYILEKSFKFGGVYFLALEFQPIIDKLLATTQNLLAANNLQIFVTIQETSGIRFVVKHLDNILNIKVTDYPFDKSDLYVQGIIEQQISDYLISFKVYIAKHALQVRIILLVKEDLKALMSQVTIEGQQIICISDSQILPLNQNPAQRFSDIAIMWLFAKQKTYLGLNSSIKSITQLNLLNFSIFNPLLSAVLVLLLILGNFKLQSWQNTSRTMSLNEKYYEITQQYRNIRQKYPNIANVTNLADLYSLEALLKIPVTTPFELLEKFLTNIDPRIYLDKISWELPDNENIISENQNIKIEVLLRLSAKELSIENGISLLEEYLQRLKNDFNNINFSYYINREKATIMAKQTIITVNIIITNGLEGGYSGV